MKKLAEISPQTISISLYLLYIAIIIVLLAFQQWWMLVPLAVLGLYICFRRAD